MDTLLALLLSQPAWVVYAVVGVVILLEGAVPAGMLLPGEATALLGGATVALGRSDLVPMVLVVVVGRDPRGRHRLPGGRGHRHEGASVAPAALAS